MFCVNCRAQIDPKTKFCPICGSRQQSAPVQTAQCRPQPVSAPPPVQVPIPPPVGGDSVFDFSMMSSQAAVPPPGQTTTGMTPQSRNARKKSSGGKPGKLIAAIVSAAVVLALAAAFVVFKVLPGVMVEQGLAKAQEYMDAGSYELAESEYDKVINADPENVQAYSGKADSLEEQGRLKEAAEVLREGYKRTSSYLLSSRCDEIEAELYGG